MRERSTAAGASRGDREDHGEDMVWFPSRGWLFLSHSDAGFITSVTVSYWCYIWNVPSRNTPASVICATRAPDRSCVARSLSRLARAVQAQPSLILVLSPRPPFLAAGRGGDDMWVCKRRMLVLVVPPRGGRVCPESQASPWASIGAIGVGVCGGEITLSMVPRRA